MYWEGKGVEQTKYDEMKAAGWEFSKKAVTVFHSYYRYYNDGDLPGWARGKREYTKPSFYGGYFHWELNELGEQAQEQRITDAILAEYKRFKRAH